MPPSNRRNAAKPRDLKTRNFQAATDWKTSSRGRHHVFLFDGTCNDETGADPRDFSWDAARQLWVSRQDPAQAFAPTVTNVVKTLYALGPDSASQLTHYFRGIGNDDENDRANAAVEGALAHEDKFIRNHAYLEFLQHYRVGDRISILGFSRGAAAARLFANDLRRLGLRDNVRTEGRLRRARNSGDSWWEPWAVYTPARLSKVLVPGDTLDISFIGVWDTVATLMGADDDDLAPPADAYCVHCVALDEERDLFKPTLLPQPCGSRAKEVWFPGCHSDIGGGYFYDALGRVTLKFMWDNWNSALGRLGAQPLTWNPEIVARRTALDGLPWLRHREDGLTTIGGLSTRDCRALDGSLPRVHPSVERFVQTGGLGFCPAEVGFPPKPAPGSWVYNPPAYPGNSAVEQYDDTHWA